MDDQLTINDLPVECVEEILKWITDRVDRIYARFVCKMWCALIDRDCSAECYQIDFPFFKSIAKYNRRFKKKVIFKEMFLPLLNSQRKKISFHFEQVNFQGSEQFWRTKGTNIISLYFGIDCFNIPLKEIVEHCSILKSFTIELNDDKDQELRNMLENCIDHGKKNFSARSLYFKRPYRSSSDVDVTYVTNIARLVGRVFLGVQNVYFEDLIFDDGISLYQANKMNSLSTYFENLKFVITLSHFKEARTIVFDRSSNVPVKMTNFTINFMSNINVLVYSLPYPGGHNYLNRLNLMWRKQHYSLDDVQVLISLLPSLKSIRISDAAGFFPLTNPLSKNNIEDLSFMNGNDNFFPLTNPLSKNNIEGLSFMNGNYNFFPLTNPLSKNNFEDLSFKLCMANNNLCSINKPFLQSFENLKSFECEKLVFSNFVKLLHRLPNLEMLEVHFGIVYVNPPDEEQTILNVKLLKLGMPTTFLLQTTVKYDFRNLRKLSLWDCGNELDLLGHNMDEQLKRMNCPKLERIFFEFNVKQFSTDQREFVNWMVNVVSLFPRLAEFMIPYNVDIIIHRESRNMANADQILKTIFGKLKYRRLRKIGSYKYPHHLTVLSHSHFIHRCPYGKSVLYIS